jgi:hypothetical protein
LNTVLTFATVVTNAEAWWLHTDTDTDKRQEWDGEKTLHQFRTELATQWIQTDKERILNRTGLSRGKDLDLFSGSNLG